MTPLALTDQEREQLQDLLRHKPQARELCRSRALLWLAAGESAADVADRLCVSRRTVYYWAERFQQRGGLDLGERLRDAPRSGRPATARGIIDPLIADVIDEDPRDLGYHATNWTAPLLQHFLADVHGVEVSGTSVSRAIDRLDLRWKRPRHQLALRPATWRQSKGGSSGACGADSARSC